MFVRFSEHLLSTYCVLRIVSGIWGDKELEIYLSWRNRLRQWTNLRISGFGRGAWLWGKAVALESAPGPPCSPGKHAVTWKELTVGTAWLRGRSRRGKDQARPARMKFLALEPRGSRGIGRLSCALSSIHSRATYGDGSYAFYVY